MRMCYIDGIMLLELHGRKAQVQADNLLALDDSIINDAVLAAMQNPTQWITADTQWVARTLPAYR